MLNDRILPWYEEQDIPILRILRDRGTEYKGKIENHAYQLFLSVAGIEHITTKAYSPQTNGICERFNKTMKEEFFEVAMRKKMYLSLYKKILILGCIIIITSVLILANSAMVRLLCKHLMTVKNLLLRRVTKSCILSIQMIVKT